MTPKPIRRAAATTTSTPTASQRCQLVAAGDQPARERRRRPRASVHFMRARPPEAASTAQPRPAASRSAPRRAPARGRPLNSPNTVGPEPVTIACSAPASRSAASAASIAGHSERAAASRSLTGERAGRRPARARRAARSSLVAARARRAGRPRGRPRASRARRRAGGSRAAERLGGGERLTCSPAPGHQRAAGREHAPGTSAPSRVGERRSSAGRATPAACAASRSAAAASLEPPPMPAATGRACDRQPLRRRVPAGRGAEAPRARAPARFGALDAGADDLVGVASAARARASARRRATSGWTTETSGCRPSARGAPTSRQRLTLPGARRVALTAQRSHSARNCSRRERLGARVGGLAERLERRARAVADRRRRLGASASERGERLAAVGEALLDERAQRRLRAPGRGACRPTSTESTFGTGRKTVARDRAQHAHVAGELGEHGRDAVGAACPGRPRSARRPPSAPSRPSVSTPGSSSIVRRITVAATP